MARLHISLFSKIAVSLIILFIGAMLSLGYTILVNQNNLQIEQKQQLALSSAKSLAEGSIDALISRDFELLERWLEALVLKDIYAYGYLSGPNGHILVHTDADKIASYSPPLKDFTVSTSRQLNYKGEPVTEIIYASKVDDEIFAYAHIAYYTTQDFLSVFNSKEIYSLLGVMVFFLVLILVATLFIIRLHTEPVRELSENIHQFSFESDKLHIADTLLQRPDEIGVLANSFQLMIQRLKTAYEDLKKEEQSLQNKVEQRTHELKKQNDLLLEMQEQLVQSKKMASLGNLVAGVAHEINTPVGICLTAVSHLRDASKIIENRHNNQTLSEEDFEHYLDTVRQSAEIAVDNISRAAKLINNFKKVAVDQHIEEAVCFNLYQHLQHIIHVLEPNLKKYEHRFHISGDESLQIISYQGVFYQIVSNLIMNTYIHAFEADSQGDIFINFSIQDKLLVFQYSDNGSGISEPILDKLFDPFVTSKRGQGGTGLGTHIVYNLVVQKLKGKIECESKEGKGTLFRLLLPLQRC